jgi:hypothetical protein
MRTVRWVIALAALSACVGEKPQPGPPSADTARMSPSADSVKASPPDSTRPMPDSIMARDTARSM